MHSVLSIKHSIQSDSRQPALSPDYLAFESILRMKPVAVHDPTSDFAMTIKQMRSTFTMGDTIPQPSECQVTKEMLAYDGHFVESYWINYPPRTFRRDSDRLLLYFHGGGYAIGDIKGK